MQIYEKILCFFSHVSFFLDKNDIEIYKSANLKYIKRKDIMYNSIYKFSLDFLKEFISKLNENSYLFFPLLILDCGTYYYNVDNKPIYGFNRESCSVIKEHLNELIPDIFFEYSEEGKSGEEESGFNYKGFKMVFINRHFTFKNLKKDPIKDEYKNEDEKRLFKHYGMLASKTLMHESFGHNKRIFNKKERIISPLRFFNRNKRFVKMVPLLFNLKHVDINNKKIEYFKSLNKKLTGESGKFFEYFFGKYNNMLIIDLIYQIDYIGNLLDNIDYFVKDNLEDLQRYIINKYKITNNKSIKYEDKNLSFEEENKIMEELIDNHTKKNMIDMKKEQKKDEENNEINEKVIEPKKDIVSFEGEYYENDEEFNESKELEENEDDSLPFFKSLHKP